MTSIREYRCNFCNGHISKSPETGIGIYFVGMASARVTPLSQTENHLCFGCAKAFRDALRDFEMPKAPDREAVA